MYTIIVQRRLLNIKYHFRSQGQHIAWSPANAWMACGIYFNCMKIWQKEEHLLLFPLFVRRPEGRRDSCGYMCTWGGGWFAPPLDYYVILYVENEVLWRRTPPAALWFSCSIIFFHQMELPGDTSVQHYSSQTCKCWHPFWWNLYSCCIFNNYHQECWHHVVIMGMNADKSVHFHKLHQTNYVRLTVQCLQCLLHKTSSISSGFDLYHAILVIFQELLSATDLIL